MRGRLARRMVTLSVLLVACRADDLTRVAPAPIQLRVVAGTVVTAGAALPVTLSNGSVDAVGYNWCASTQLEQQRAGQWTRVDQRDRVCNLSLTVLAAGGRGEGFVFLPRTLGAGTYRVVIVVSPERAVAAPIRAESGAFTVA